MAEEIRFLDHDHHNGTSRYLVTDDDDPAYFRIVERQEVTPTIEENKRHFKAQEKHTPYSGNAPNRVASIPLQTWLELQKAGITDDPVLFKKWLNDPDNRAFRTRPGRV